MANHVNTTRLNLIRHISARIIRCPLLRHHKEGVPLKTALFSKPDSTTFWNTGYVAFACWVVLYNKKEDVVGIGEASRLGTPNIHKGGEEKEKRDLCAQLAGMTESKKKPALRIISAEPVEHGEGKVPCRLND